MKESHQPLNPKRLITGVMRHGAIKTDSDLARLLGVSPSLISRVRHGDYAVSAELLLRMHDKIGLSIAELRALLYSPVN